MTVWAERLLIVALAWGALAFGAVYSWAYWPLAMLCAAIGLQAIVRAGAWQDPRTRHLGIALAVVAGAIAIQVVPLPYHLVERLSPALDRFFREYYVFYEPATSRPLSLAPDVTLVALGLFAAFALFAVGLIRTVRHMSIDWLMNQVMGLGVALSLIGVIQKVLVDASDPLIYGFWKSEHGGDVFGPFINRNHFAGWLVMALPPVAGYACAVFTQTWSGRAGGFPSLARWLATVEASRFVLVSFSVLLMGMALVLTGSRSGIVSLAAALIVFAVLAMRQLTSRRARVQLLGYAALMLVGAVVWAGTDLTVRRFLTARADAPGRVQAWQDTTRIIADFPVWGTGLGTYGQAMLVYQTAGRPRMYLQAHNDYLQLAAEGGMLVVVPAAVVMGLVLAGIRRRLRPGADDAMTGWIRTGAVAGLAGIAVQSLVEFSLQMPGNRVLFGLLVAIALHRPRGAPRRASRAMQRLVTEHNADRV